MDVFLTLSDHLFGGEKSQFLQVVSPLYVSVGRKFCVVLIEEKFCFFESSCQRIESLNDIGSGPSGLVIEHGDDFVPDFFVVILKLFEGI